MTKGQAVGFGLLVLLIAVLIPKFSMSTADDNVPYSIYLNVVFFLVLIIMHLATRR